MAAAINKRSQSGLPIWLMMLSTSNMPRWDFFLLPRFAVPGFLCSYLVTGDLRCKPIQFFALKTGINPFDAVFQGWMGGEKRHFPSITKQHVADFFGVHAKVTGVAVNGYFSSMRHRCRWGSRVNCTAEASARYSRCRDTAALIQRPKNRPIYPTAIRPKQWPAPLRHFYRATTVLQNVNKTGLAGQSAPAPGYRTRPPSSGC